MMGDFEEVLPMRVKLTDRAFGAIVEASLPPNTTTPTIVIALEL